jgi:3-(3-hydroxy-phenyl)propionate hydroxylase
MQKAAHLCISLACLESSGDEFRQSLQAIGADPVRTREYLLRVSMIASLRRAEELG